MLIRATWAALILTLAVTAAIVYSSWNLLDSAHQSQDLEEIVRIDLIRNTSRLGLEHHHFNVALNDFISGRSDLDAVEVQEKLSTYRSELENLQSSMKSFRDAVPVVAEQSGSVSLAADKFESTATQLEVTGLPTLDVMQGLIAGMRSGDVTRGKTVRDKTALLKRRLEKFMEESLSFATTLATTQQILNEELRYRMNLASIANIVIFGLLVVLYLVQQKFRRQLEFSLVEISEKLKRTTEEANNLSSALERKTHHDKLTGTLNRKGFMDSASSLLAHQGTHGLALVHLDNLRSVNWTHGKAAREALLKDISRLLKSTLPESCFLGKYSDEEFILMVQHASRGEFEFILEQLRDRLRSHRFQFDNQANDMQGRIGGIHITDSKSDIESLIAFADAASRSVDSATSIPITYSDGESVEVEGRESDRNWVEQINKGLLEDRFCLFYQSIVSVDVQAGQRTHSWEVLVRLIDETGRVKMPEEFLPVAARCSMSSDIDRWVVTQAFNWINKAPKELLTFQFLSINLSHQSVRDRRFIEFLEQQSQLLLMPTSSICFEITDNSTLDDHDIENLKLLQDIGFKLALDDFGLGTAPLARLESLPFDFIKIDGHYVKDLDVSESHREFVKAVSNMGKALKKFTVAEYVDDKKVMKILAELGIDYAQGYLIDKPQPLPQYPTNLDASAA